MERIGRRQLRRIGAFRCGDFQPRFHSKFRVLEIHVDEHPTHRQTSDGLKPKH